MPQSVIILLRLLHIMCGAIWFGAVIVMTFYFMPAIGAAGPAGGAVMKQVGDRKYPQFVMAMMGLTILSGLGLMWYASSAFGPVWFRSPMGRTISLGAAIAIVASIYGSVFLRPTVMRMQALGAEMAGGAPNPAQATEMKTLQSKVTTATRLVAILMILAVAAMAGARYM
jgi:uncharacterized membrane protein